MEGQFASAIHLPDVPKTGDLSDRLPSPNSCPQLGIGGGCGTSGLLGSNSASYQNSSGIAESSITLEGFSNQSLWQNPGPLNHMDLQLYSNLGGVHPANDMFWNPLLDDLPGNERLHGAYCACPDCLDELYLVQNSWMNRSDFKSKTSYSETSNCPGSHCFSEKETTAPQSVPCNAYHEVTSTPKETSVNALVPSQSTEISLEESILMDFELAVSPLNKETRIYLRDTLYRLADNNKQYQMATKAGSGGLAVEKLPPCSEYNQTMRSLQRRTEMETNVIDRAVANIMFDKVDLKNQGLSHKPSASLVDEEMIKVGQIQYQSLWGMIFPSNYKIPVVAASDGTEGNTQSGSML